MAICSSFTNMFITAKGASTTSNESWSDFAVELGTYNGKKINWRSVENDENGRLMVSDSILCYKSFDAAFSGYSNYNRKNYGSNY